MVSRCIISCTKTLVLPCQRPFILRNNLIGGHRRLFSAEQSSAPVVSKPINPTDLEELLSKPTWSVESLLPPKTGAHHAPKISSQQLHHLLRLSALPLPKSPEAEQKMLDTLSAQLHFVGEIQQVDTTGVTPLRAIRDETPEAEEEQTITLDTLKAAIGQEQVIGKHYKRIQRRTHPVNAKNAEDWNVLGSAERRAGQYFMVESERPQQ